MIGGGGSPFQLPIQPVNKPILCSPYEEPTEHWVYDTATGEASQMPGRRPGSYWYKTQRTGSAQQQLFAEEERDDLPLVNTLRDDVRRWRQANKPAPEDRPKNHVRALPEWKPFEMRFPVVEGYAFALQRNLIKADINEVEPLILESSHTPTAVFVKPQVGYQLGRPTAGGGFAFEIARQLLWKLTEGTGGATPKLWLRSRHQLFPQVYRVVDEYVRRKVHRRDCHPCELGLATYVERAVERLYDAIEPNDEQGESPLLPILNRYKPVGKKPSQPGGAGYGNLGAVSGVSPGAVADGGLLRSQRPPGVRDSL